MNLNLFAIVLAFIAGLAVAAYIYEYSLRQLNRACRESLENLQDQANDYVYKGRQ